MIEFLLGPKVARETLVPTLNLTCEGNTLGTSTMNGCMVTNEQRNAESLARLSAAVGLASQSSEQFDDCSAAFQEMILKSRAPNMANIGPLDGGSLQCDLRRMSIP